jgi:HD-GYP domain-containing protein (c-di-GMP phosphodiesterase class II)
VQHDQRHYTRVDQKSGFVTRSILAVPLRSRPIDLGQGRGMSRERIIGGLEAINKIGGPFMPDDIELLEILARGASTILVVSRMYVDANNMFVDVIQALVTSIDAKDPYTEKRSQRISDFSAEIARELGLNEEEIHNIRVASLFHDLNMMGLPEQVFRKPGARISEGHGRTDSPEPVGSGEPAGSGEPVVNTGDSGPTRLLGGTFFNTSSAGEADRPGGNGETQPEKEENNRLIDKIIAVANVFDSMTADSAFEEGMSGKEALLYLRENAGTRFDQACVEALARAYDLGKIKVRRRR